MSTDQQPTAPPVPNTPPRHSAGTQPPEPNSGTAATTFSRTVGVVLAALAVSALVLSSILLARSPQGAASAVASDVDQQLCLIRQNPPGRDQIVRLNLQSGAEQVLVQGDGLIGYAAAGDTIATISQDPSGVPTLRVGPTGKKLRQLISGSLIGQLQMGPAGVIGFTAVQPELADPLANPLYVFDPASASLNLLRVSGLRSPVEARTWIFVPGTKQLLVHEIDGQITAVDPFGTTQPLPIGRAQRMWGLEPGSSRLWVRQDGQLRVIDLASGTTQTLEVSLPPQTRVRALIPLSSSPPALVVEPDTPDPSIASEPTRLLVAGPDGVRELRQSPPGIRIIAAAGSPNGRYIAVTERPVAEGSSVQSSSYGSDDYVPGDQLWLVTVADGSSRLLSGTTPRWGC